MKHFSTRCIILALFLSVLMMFSACSNNDGNKNEHTHAYIKGECSCGHIDGTYYTEGLIFSRCEDGYKVVDYNGDAYRVMIPATYQGLPVTVIGETALAYKSSYGTVHIGENVHTIEKYAFCGAQRLVEIVIPENIKNIGIGAFDECIAVKNIYYNATECNSPYVGRSFAAKDDGIWTGVGKKSITRECVLTIGRNVKVIPDGMFHLPTGAKQAYITKVVFEDNSLCEKIGYVAFYNLRDLAVVDFGENSRLKFVGETAFGNAFKVEEYIFPDTIEKIEKYAFGGNKALTTVRLPEGPWQAVYIYYSEEKDRFPFTVGTPEENFAFYCAYSKYHLMKHACQIVEGVCECGNVDSTYCTDGLEFVKDKFADEYIVTGYKGEKSEVLIPAVYQGLPVTKIAKEAFMNNNIITFVRVPDSVKVVEERAFFGASELVEIKMSFEVEFIGQQAFSNAEKLERLRLNRTNWSVIKYDGEYEDEVITYTSTSAEENCIFYKMHSDWVFTLYVEPEQ